ncbi:TPA: hypothetical protein ACJHHJ_002200 [Staphylococcus pseudintermedius]
MKIKTKKQMTLPQLIEWAWKNGIKNKDFSSNQCGVVEITSSGFFRTETLVELDELFEVEVEEEITEETMIPFLIEIYTNDWCVKETVMHLDNMISKILSLNKTLSSMESLAFYILNDDMTMTLIWKDGKLVE